MANKKTAKKLNKKPNVGDIIAIVDYRHYLVLERIESPCQFRLLELDSGHERWYDFDLWMRRWKKIA